MSKHLAKTILKSLGLQIRRIPSVDPSHVNIADFDLYNPLFSPWLGKGEFFEYYQLAAPKTLVSADRCYVIHTLLTQALQLDGDVWECGVYQGGTAAMMASIIRDGHHQRTLHLFDTFDGMPETNAEKDIHKKGDFSDTSLEAVMSYIGDNRACVYHMGFIPHTFAGLEDAKVAFAHIDVDIYQSILDCLNFIWPRLCVGGFVVFDDYGFPTCPGARASVDEFFASRACRPLCLHTGQALVFKGIVEA